jgi:NTP pyrophosphatase (non-canonical NTP hydrolase)
MLIDILVAHERATALADINEERKRQEELRIAGKFLWTCADPDQSNPRKLAVLTEETGEVAREVTEEMIFQDKVKRDPCSVKHSFLDTFSGSANRGHIKAKHRAKLREELVQVAAVCVAWIESLDQYSKE